MKRFAWSLILLGLAAALAPIVGHLIGQEFGAFFAYPIIGMIVLLGGCILLAGAWIATAIAGAGGVASGGEAGVMAVSHGSTLRAVAYTVAGIALMFHVAHTFLIRTASEVITGPQVWIVGFLSTGPALFVGAVVVVAATLVADAITSATATCESP